jgi:hypothetical protein
MSQPIRVGTYDGSRGEDGAELLALDGDCSDANAFTRTVRELDTSLFFFVLLITVCAMLMALMGALG